jgi:APA family basic amino acid/polyamine antiporter
VLGPWQLVSLGVGATIGAGIFVMVGEAAATKAGPSLMLSFVVAGIACGFAAFCYAEFASMVPIAGSAYTYAYTTLGELMAWIIGWDLVLEYAVSSAAVAQGWSKYFQDLLGVVRVGGKPLMLPESIRNAPFEFNGEQGRFVTTGSWIDLPALLITGLLTWVLIRGIRASARFNTLMVVIKVAVVLLVIVVGACYINPANWTPFAPYGYSGISFFGQPILGTTSTRGEPLGMMAGAAIIFFAYIGFDAVSTHAEEARNPRRDVPFGIIGSLVVCTALYIGVTAVLTGMVPYDQIDRHAPVSAAFGHVGQTWIQAFVSLGAITGITSVLLVTMLSQPRVLLAMARDGLLPISFFGAVHPHYRTPWKSTLLTGLVVGLLGSLLPLDVLADLVSIGTLLAFVIVCGAVLVMRHVAPDAPRPFRVPFGPVFPVLGILTCLLLMFSLPLENWWRLGGWLAVGLVIYFGYGRHHSHLARNLLREETQEGLSPPASRFPHGGAPPGDSKSQP